MSFFSKLFTRPESREPNQLPRPKWTPGFSMPSEHVIERISYYTNEEKDFVVFKNGTCVVVKDRLSEEKAIRQASEFLSKVLYLKPSMDPIEMEDGNTLVRYGFPVYNLVIRSVAQNHQSEISANHMDGLIGCEQIETELGLNKFDTFMQHALLGRSYFYQDVVDPIVIDIVRHT